MTTPFWYGFWYGAGASVAIVVHAICSSSHTTSRRWWTTAILVFGMTQAAGICVALDAGGNMAREGMTPLRWAILAGGWIAGTVANLAILYGSIRSPRRDENRWRQRPAMVAFFAVVWTLTAFMSTSAVAGLVGLSAVRNAASRIESTVSLPPPWWHPFSDPKEVFAAADRGEAWVLTTGKHRMSCGGGPTLMLFNHPDTPRPRMAADWAAPWPNPPAGGVWLREFSVKCPDAEPSPARPQASVESAAAAAWAAGFAFQWRDACGRNRVALTASEVYTIPDDVPRKGQSLTPDRALNAGCPR